MIGIAPVAVANTQSSREFRGMGFVCRTDMTMEKNILPVIRAQRAGWRLPRIRLEHEIRRSVFHECLFCVHKNIPKTKSIDVILRSSWCGTAPIRTLGTA